MDNLEMLKKILGEKDCAECLGCCKFDTYETWEIPVCSEEQRDLILKHKPGTQFLEEGGVFRFKITPVTGDLWVCPALTETGCFLGDKKPFECRVWGFRVMEISGSLWVCVAGYCPVLYKKSLKELVDFLVGEKVAAKMFEYAANTPQIIKPYNEYYIPLIKEGSFRLLKKT
jgi:Fe-S-cluster containining protein